MTPTTIVDVFLRLALAAGAAATTLVVLVVLPFIERLVDAHAPKR